MNGDGGEEWKRQLGTVWRLAASSLGTVRDVVVRSSHEGRLRMDLALYQRERRDVLADLGQLVMSLVDAGRLDASPEMESMIDRVREVEARIRADSEQVHDNAFGAPRGYEPEAGNYESPPEESGDREDEVSE